MCLDSELHSSLVYTNEFEWVLACTYTYVHEQGAYQVVRKKAKMAMAMETDLVFRFFNLNRDMNVSGSKEPGQQQRFILPSLWISGIQNANEFQCRQSVLQNKTKSFELIGERKMPLKYELWRARTGPIATQHLSSWYVYTWWWYHFVWRRHENKYPCIVNKVNASYERITEYGASGSCPGPLTISPGSIW